MAVVFTDNFTGTVSTPLSTRTASGGGAWQCFGVTATDIGDPDITGSQCTIGVTAPNEGTVTQLQFINAPRTFGADSQSGAMTVQAQDVSGTPIAVTQASDPVTKTVAADQACTAATN